MELIERTVTVARPFSVVWPFLADFANGPLWNPSITTIRRLTGQGEEGTAFYGHFLWGNRDFDVMFTVESSLKGSLRLGGETDGLIIAVDLSGSGDAAATTVSCRLRITPEPASPNLQEFSPVGLKQAGDELEAALVRSLETI